MAKNQEGYGDNIKYRAQHGSLELRKVRSGINGKVITTCLEDSMHKKLREALETHGVLETALRLRSGFDALTGSMGCKISNPHAIGSTTRNGEMSDNGAVLYADYCKWYKECERLKKAPKICVSVICYDMSVREIAKEYHLGRESVMKAVIDCLKIYQNI